MFTIHECKWKEIARTYAPPVDNYQLPTKTFDQTEIIKAQERLTMGVTTILWQCADENCGNTKKEEMLGKVI